MAKREVKTKKNFFTELSDRYKRVNERKYYYYFLWRNKLSNNQTDFSLLSEEEFINKYLRKKLKGKTTSGTRSFEMLKMWESTDEYQGIMQEYYSIKMNQDFYKLYETYLEKAMGGDEKALNALKTVKKEIESLNKTKKIKNSKNNEENDEEFDLT